MDLKYTIQDLSSDLSFISQLSSTLTKQSESVKKKADAGLAAGMSASEMTMDGSYFLSKELFDLNPEYFSYCNNGLDYSVNRFKRLFGIPFTDGTSPTIQGPLNRKWISTCRVLIDNNQTLSGNAVIDGVTLANNDRVLVVNYSSYNVTANNVVLLGQNHGVWVVNTAGAWARSTDNLEFAAVKITEGTRYANTYWWCQNRVEDSYFKGTSWVAIRECTPATIAAGNGSNLTGSAFNAASSHKINGNDYYTLVKSVDTDISTLKTNVTTFYNHVVALKATTEAAATSAAAALVLADKVTIESRILSILSTLYNLEVLCDFYSPILPESKYYKTGDSLFESQGGYQIKPYKSMTSTMTAASMDKMYNNNSTKSQGDGSGGASPRGAAMTGGTGKTEEILNDHNAIIEYWSQIGWMASERANNYKSYVELLEQDLTDRDLEEILVLHDKAITNTMKKMKGERKLFDPFSPKPPYKDRREWRDKDLPWTDEELVEKQPLF